MFVAVSLPRPERGRAELAELVRLAERSGAEAIVLAGAPWGQWAAPAEAAVAVHRVTTLPIGIVLDPTSEHPLHLAETMAVLQRIIGPGLWPLVDGTSGADESRPLLDLLEGGGGPVTPGLIRHGVPPWLLLETAVGLTTEYGWHGPLMARPPIVDAEGAFLTLSERNDLGSATTLLVDPIDRAGLADCSEVIPSWRYPRMATEEWIAVATSGWKHGPTSGQ